jgi:hypothetical protein
MRYQFLLALVLALGVCLVPVAVAQNQTGQPAVTNPPGYGDQSPGEAPYPQVAPAQTQGVPPSLTLPAGTLVRVRLIDTLSSDRNNPGDGFTTVLEQPIVVQGWVVARRGQTALGRVVTAQKAGRVQGVSQLAIELSDLALVDGQQVPIRTQLVQNSAGTSRVRDAAAVGTTTGTGAAIGAAAGGGEGAAIGAAAGAVAGIVGVLSTRGRATELYPETLLTFRLEDPVTISTEQSQQAFRPVSQQDYAGNAGQRNAQGPFRGAETYPPPYYYPPYYYPPYYYPPYWYYGYYGVGPGFYVVPRVYFGGGYRGRHR